jgi:hypothetical protein
VIEADEFGFMKSNLFFKAVVPLFMMDEASLLCITTPSDDPTSQYSEMLHMKRASTQEPAFKHYQYAFVCPKCRKKDAGLDAEGKSTVLTCPHKQHRLPPWQSERKQNLVHDIMANRIDDLKRETLGLITENTNSVFSRSKIESLFALPLYRNEEESVKIIYVCIDPNTGTHDARTKAGSDFAMLSTYETRHFTKHVVICGMESIDSHEPQDYRDHVVHHLRKLRESQMTYAAKLVLIIENNLGYDYVI